MVQYTRTALACLLALGACSRPPRTDEQLTGRAEQAVDRKLGIQAQFSLVEATVSQQIACGHASVQAVSRDWVYRDGKVILDDDPDFDDAAVQCDAAIGEGNPDVNAAEAP